MDALITKIMNFAQKLVDADRASLFLVDSKTNQLFARIFDIQGGSMEGFEDKDLAKEIRYSEENFGVRKTSINFELQISCWHWNSWICCRNWRNS